MQLTFDPFDGRARCHRSIIDADTGRKVGEISSEGVGTYRYGGITISLFGGKYTTTVRRYDQCWGFVKGVEAVLDHMIGKAHRIPKESQSAA